LVERTAVKTCVSALGNIIETVVSEVRVLPRTLQ